jgi:hypothetical protein
MTSTYCKGCSLACPESPASLPVASSTTSSTAQLSEHAALLLPADQPDAAMPWFQKCAVTAANPIDKKTANDWIARTIKAHDGVVGRANSWMGTHK